MKDNPLGKELAIGFGLGLLTNFIWAIISQQFNLYQIALIFAVSLVLYYLAWKFMLRPLQISKKQRVKAVYNSYKDARPIIKQKIQVASNIGIISVGGGAIVEDERGWILETLLKRSHEDGVRIRILLLNPNSQVTQTRSKELDNLSSSKFPSDALEKYILNNARKILERDSKVELRYYDSKPVWRLYILDETIFVSFYLSNKEGHHTQMTQLEKGSDLFSAFERTFDILWENGQNPILPAIESSKEIAI